MIRERGIAKQWVDSTLTEPVSIDEKDDGTLHYQGPIAEREGRHLRIIVNPATRPKTIITAFFDRGLGRKI